MIGWNKRWIGRPNKLDGTNDDKRNLSMKSHYVMGNGARSKVGGLEGRVKWERTAITELALYIPYGVEISSCEHQP